MITRLSALLFALSACKPADEVPDEAAEGSTYNLESAIMYVFAGFEEDPAEMAKALIDLEAAIETNAIDLEATPRDRAFEIDTLGGDDLGGVTPPPGTDPANQVTVFELGLSRHDLDGAKQLVAEANQVCIESNSTKFYRRTYTTDLDCFVDGSCDIVRTTNEVYKDITFAKAWYDLFKDFRTIDLGDGRTAMIARAWIEESAAGEAGGTEFTQNFNAEVWIPKKDDPSKTIRGYAIWAETKIPAIGPDTISAVTIGALDEGFQHADLFLDGDEEYCNLDRDRPYDRGE